MARNPTTRFNVLAGVLSLEFWLFPFFVASLEEKRSGFVVVETSSAYGKPLFLSVELQ
jgi:hypothetical protein